MKDFDIIVIGSGIGGLISASLLSSKGFKVLVIEKQGKPGGYLSSFRRKGFIFNSAVDCIAGIGPERIISLVLERLGVERLIEFVRVDPIRVSIFPDIEINVDSDINVYINNLKSLFPSEKDGIGNLFRKINEIYSSIENKNESLINGRLSPFPEYNMLYQFVNNSYSDLIRNFIKNKKLTSILSDRCSFIGLPPSKTSVLSMVSLIMTYFKMGAYRPIGGYQKLSNIFAAGIINKGGKIIFGKQVEKILLEGNLCYGVQTVDKERYSGRFIISNADFMQTFIELIGGKYVSLAEERLRYPGISSSFFIVYIGLKESFYNLQKYSSIGYFPSYDMENFFNSKFAFGNKSSLGITIPSIEDKTLSPEGCHSLILHEIVDFGFVEQWNKHKSELIDRLLQKVENLIPDVRKNIVHIGAATPLTLKKYTFNYDGAAYGWKQVPGYTKPFRHNIHNLFIAGHWCGMGGGVLASAYSGFKSAVEICRKEGISI